MSIYHKLFFLIFFSNINGEVVLSQTSIKTVNLNFSSGYQTTNLRWSIAGDENGENPNVLSELKWRNLNGLYWKFGGNILQEKHWGAKLNFGIHHILSGSVSDKDYANDNRQNAFYDEEFSSNKGYEFFGDALVNYRLKECSGIQIIPFLGFTIQRQKVFLKDETIEPEPLNSTYKNYWTGLKTGFDFKKNYKNVDLGLSIGGSFLKYKAKANWNLIPEFAKPVSFIHNANAIKLDASIQAEYKLNSNTKIFTNIGYAFSKAFEGDDEAFYESRDPVKTQLNEVVSKTWIFAVGISYNLVFWDKSLKK